MDVFLEDSQDDTPRIELDMNKGIFLFEGKSLPENADDFYEPILQWFKEYKNNPNKMTKVIFKLDYFDSASSKKLLDMLFVLKDIASTLTIEWHYYNDDDDMYETGRDFEEILELNFKMVAESYV